MADLILKNARLPSGDIADISIENGIITHIGSSDFGKKLDCRGHLLIPAAADMHVHMRDGLQSKKEDWKSATQSAASGGVACVVDQPNSIPEINSRENFRRRLELASENSYCHFGINGYVSENSDFFGLIDEGVLAFGEMFAAASSYGNALTPEVIKRSLRILADCNMLVTVHAETVSSTDVHSLKEHCSSRDADGEVSAIKFVNSLAPKNARLHYCHISSAKSISEISGTFEAAPHHLFLNYEDAQSNDTLFKMNPPLRTKKEQTELLSRFNEIPVIASDHAPHTLDDKSAEFSKAPSGVPGVETMMPLLMNAVYEKKISLNSVIEKTVVNPCRILNISRPDLAVGCRADLCVYDDRPIKIRAENLHSKAGWTPYENMYGIFPYITIINGTPVWNKGEFEKPDVLWFRSKTD